MPDGKPDTTAEREERLTEAWKRWCIFTSADMERAWWFALAVGAVCFAPIWMSVGYHLARSAAP